MFICLGALIAIVILAVNLSTTNSDKDKTLETMEEQTEQQEPALQKESTKSKNTVLTLNIICKQHHENMPI